MKSVVINKEDLRYNIQKIKEYAETNLPDDNGKKSKNNSSSKSKWIWLRN